jgi:hypothetical protein
MTNFLNAYLQINNNKMKTTYLFGAGASANAIPTIDGLIEGLKVFKKHLNGFLTMDLSGLDSRIESYRTDLENLIDIYKELIFESKWHQTIDTVARKYYLTNDYDKYKKLKIGITVYFLYCQFFEDKIHSNSINPSSSTTTINLDKRYDSFFATLLNKNTLNEIDINQNISIITWNYDLQIELALYNYENKIINKLKNKYNILPNRECLDSLDPLNHTGFKVFKLNGNAFLDLGYSKSLESTIYDTLLQKIKFDKSIIFDFFLGELLETISTINSFSKGNESTFLRYFNFSWEIPNDDTRCYPSKNDVINFARSTIAETDCLVIVGYSFPDFNWDIDRFILEKSKFKRIIIQDKEPDKIENRLVDLIPNLKNKPTKDFIKPEIIKMIPGNYFPRNVEN